MFLLTSKEKSDFENFMENVPRAIDFNLRLPSMIFKEKIEQFWFFERPLMNSYDLVEGIIELSGMGAFIKLSGIDPLMESFFPIGKDNIHEDVMKAYKASINFGNGSLSYPLVFCDSHIRWIAVEDVTEDFGVLALKDNFTFNNEKKFLETNFISPSQMIELSESGSHGSRAARVFVENYVLTD